MKRILCMFLTMLIIAFLSCRERMSPTENSKHINVSRYTYKIIKTYPHDHEAFTQGLAFEKGFLYEGTGLYGRSSVRKIHLETGRTEQMYKLPAQYFGEGITVYKNTVIQLTWRSQIGFVYDKKSFKLLRIFHYPTEGWGITHDGKQFIMSDGTAKLYFLHPETFQKRGVIEVHDLNGPVENLNELEYVRGRIYANVWKTDTIAIIDPGTGRVTGWIHLKGILSSGTLRKHVDVLNGIAYDKKEGRLFVTGKLWPVLFEMELVRTE
jgi:glutamine cyclotransferase